MLNRRPVAASGAARGEHASNTARRAHRTDGSRRSGSNRAVRQSIEAEAPTGSECEHGRGSCAEEGARPATSTHGPHATMMAMGSKSGLTLAMFDTLAVFQLAMFWLKAVAPWNMLDMVVVLAVFHAPMS